MTIFYLALTGDAVVSVLLALYFARRIERSVREEAIMAHYPPSRLEDTNLQYWIQFCERVRLMMQTRDARQDEDFFSIVASLTIVLFIVFALPITIIALAVELT